MKGKIFTRDEATNMIPLVRRIVLDAKACTRLIDRHEKALCDSEPLAEDEPAERKRKLRSLHDRLDECRKELEELGCFLEDAGEGIVKLYGEMSSRIVYFTWRLGEPSVSFWHPIEKSFGDRQPIDGDECVAENAGR